MKAYNLISERLITGNASAIKLFATKEKAEAAMRAAWGRAITEYKDSGMEPLKEECFMNDDYAILVRRRSVNGKDPIVSIETWKIKEAELDIQVAVRIENGLVQEIYANADLNAQVYDLDVSDFPEDGEEDERDKRAKEWDELTQHPDWHQIW